MRNLLKQPGTVPFTITGYVAYVVTHDHDVVRDIVGDGDGVITGADIQRFIDILLDRCCPP